jgi:DNA-binding transcriptional LysR family regulator
MKRIQLRHLDGVDMVMYPRHTQPVLYDRIVACCEQAGFHPHIAQEAITKRATIALVAAGIGVAMVPRSSRKTPRVGVVFRPLVARLPKVEISAVWRQGNVPVTLAAFLKTLRKHKVLA